MQLTRRFNHPVGDLFAEFDRLFRAPFGLGAERVTDCLPRGINLFETDGDWRLRVDLPGFAKEDLEVTLKAGLLAIHAHREDDSPGVSGHFERSLRVPKEIAADRISARLENGVLELTLPKVEPETPETTRIEIN